MGTFIKLDKMKGNKAFRVILGTSALGLGATGTALATSGDADEARRTSVNDDVSASNTEMDLEGSAVEVASDEEILADVLDDEADSADVSPDSPDTPDTADSPATPDSPASPQSVDSPASPESPESPASPPSPESPASPDSPDSPQSAESPDSPNTPDSPDDDD
ncbi:hypothetical protein BH20ACT23_BH20ACT23_25550 [soil metagenome]